MCDTLQEKTFSRATAPASAHCKMTQCGKVRAQRPRYDVPEPGKGGQGRTQHPPTESICGPNFGCESRTGPTTDVRDHTDAVRSDKEEIERVNATIIIDFCPSVKF